MVSMRKLFSCLMLGTMLTLNAATLCTTDALIAGDACDGPDMPGSEDASSFLQISSRIAARSSSNDSQPEWIQPFNCKKYPVPIQVLKDGDKGFAFKELNVETGEYNTLFDIPFDRAFPAYKDLNSCGINPVDSIAYCTLWSGSGGHYIVRVGPTKIAFVLKLPDPKGKTFNTGTFAPDGTFFIADQKANFVVINDLHKMGGCKGEKNKELNMQYADAPLVQPNGFHSAADVVVIAKDLEGLGKTKYAIVLNKASVMIARYTKKKGFQKTWKFPYKKGEKSGVANEVWGAGWNFGGRVFFAHNKGEGVFEVPVDELNLKGKSLKPVVLKKIGKSEASGFNDGTNCINGGNPWVTKVLPFDCKEHPAPFQAMRVPGEKRYAMAALNMKTGEYDFSNGWSLPFKTTTPAFKYLNAIGVNPLDSTAYGCLLFKEYPAMFFIVRFDGVKIEYVVKVVDEYDPVAGTFNSKGDYFVIHNNEYTHNIEMFAFQGLDGMKGFDTPSKAPKLQDLPFLKLWNLWHFSDIVTVKHNFNNTGVKEYVMGVNQKQQAVFIDYDSQNISASRVIKYRTNYPFGKHKMLHNYGAAWSFNDRLFFSANDGLGVVEAAAIDNMGTLTLQKVGKSKAVVNNDGFNCWNIDSPFPGGWGGVRRPPFKRR